MDNNQNKPINQYPSNPMQVNNSQQSAASPVEPTQQVQTPVQNPVQNIPTVPVSASLKEQGPIQSSNQQLEYVVPSTPELVLGQDVKEAGVEVKSEFPQVSQDAQNVGLVHSKEATEVAPIISKNLSLQTPKQQVMSILHIHKKVKESIRWLATLITRQFKVQEEKGVSV